MPEETTLNIYQKLAKIRRPVEILQKDKSGYGYKYVSDEQILAKIQGLMDKFKVSLVPCIEPGTTNVTPYTYTSTKTTRDGKTFEQQNNEIIVKADMVWSWVNNDHPSDRINVPWSLVGQQSDASQAFGSGLSYCRRYFLLAYFNIAASEDDPDRLRSMRNEAKDAEDREIAAEIISRAVVLINEHLTEKPEDRDEIVRIVKQYAKEKGKPSANPNAITDPNIAGQLLRELSEKFALQPIVSVD